MINVLLVINGNTGLQYHRQISPHIVMDRITGGVEYNVSSTSNFDLYPDYKLQMQQIVVFLRTISLTGKSKEVIARCHKFGAKVIVDIDDFWILPDSHMMKKRLPDNFIRNTEEAIKNCDLITTTTKLFAKKISEYTNKPIEVLPNCIDKLQDQWQPREKNERITRFGWVGGLWHYPDIKLMEKSFQCIVSDTTLTSARFVLGGYNDNDEYNRIDAVMSCNGQLGERYKRVASMDYNNYGKIYDCIDVALIPLVNNSFNAMKSPLKLLEASAKGCSAIASNVQPYIEFPKETYFGVDVSDNFKGWYKAIKQMHNSHAMREDYRMKLKEFCDMNFNAETHAENRNQIYKHLIN